MLKKTNNETIIEHLKEIGSITPLEALFVHRIQRLAPRIEELRRGGANRHMIETTKATDMAGNPYTRYVYTGIGPKGSRHGFVSGVRVPREEAQVRARTRHARVARFLKREAAHWNYPTRSQAIQQTMEV